MPILSRVQRNEIFAMIQREGLDPVDFQWMDSKDRDGPKEVLAHAGTNARIEFSATIDAGFWITWWPSVGGRGHRTESANVWREAVEPVANWIKAVHADHSAPNLWAEVSKEHAISDATERGAEYAKPFSPAELKQLESSLSEIERYITTTQPLNEQEKQAVRNRFIYLLDAAKAGGRKIDWLNIFVAQVIAMVTTGLLDARVYSTVMAHAATVLNVIFQFGLKLLG